MATNSNIEWCDATWNCLAGCSEISPGCQNCYAATMAHRLAAMGQKKYIGTTKKLPNGKIVWTGKINLDPDSLEKPLGWKKPKRIFVNSMSDLFHEDVPDEFIDKVFGVMGACEDQDRFHTFQVLTKRSERMRDYMLYRGHKAWNARRLATEEYPPRNIWLGVSVENDAYRGRVAQLMQTPAALRFISAEPLLGPLQLAGTWAWKEPGFSTDREVNPFAGFIAIPDCDFTAGPIHWVIVGGESGPGARVCDSAWIWSIIEQCKAAGVACFVKQAGSNPQDVSGNRGPDSPLRLRDKKGGDMAEWPERLRVREFPKLETCHA